MPVPRGDRLTHATESATNVDTDGSGQTSITVNDLKSIPDDTYATAEAGGGYVVNVDSVSGNSVTVTIYSSGGTSGAELAAETNVTDLTDVTVSAFGK